MKRVYVVYGYDYKAKKEARFTIDKRDITPYVCRVFARMEDVEKYIVDFFKEHASDDTILNLHKSKNGYFSADMTNAHENSGIVYGTVIEVMPQDITEDIGDSNLFDDLFSIFNG